MDLETMMQKIDLHKYESGKMFLEDVDLICSNALEYNPDKGPSGRCLDSSLSDWHQSWSKNLNAAIYFPLFFRSFNPTPCMCLERRRVRYRRNGNGSRIREDVRRSSQQTLEKRFACSPIGFRLVLSLSNVDVFFVILGDSPTKYAPKHYITHAMQVETEDKPKVQTVSDSEVSKKPPGSRDKRQTGSAGHIVRCRRSPWFGSRRRRFVKYKRVSDNESKDKAAEEEDERSNSPAEDENPASCSSPTQESQSAKHNASNKAPSCGDEITKPVITNGDVECEPGEFPPVCGFRGSVMLQWNR